MVSIYDIIDSIINPVLIFLTDAINYLKSIQMVASRGIDIGHYLGWLSTLGTGWLALFLSVTASLMLLAVIFVSRSVYSLYLNFKDGVKWW